MTETQLLTLMLVIKKIKKEVKKHKDSFLLIADDIKELDKRIKQISLEDLKKDFKDKMITLEDSYKAILEAHNKEIDTKLVYNTTEQEIILNAFKNTLKEIEIKLSSFVTKDEFKQLNKQIDDKLKTIPKNVSVKIGKVETLDPGEEAKVEVQKTNDSYVLNFYIPRGVSGRGMPGKGVPEGGTTNQVLVKNSNDDYDTKWSSAGSTSQIQSDWNQTDNTEVDYIKNKPTIPSPYTLPTASTTVLGGVKIDGSTINITDGVISAVTGGSGDVTGPSSAVADNIATYNGTTGKIIKDGGNKISDLVPKTRTITINGTTQDLTADSTYTITTGSSGYAANVYLTNNISSTVGSYKALSYLNDVSTTEFSTSVTNEEKLIQTYIYDTAIGTTVIDAGTWLFNFYAKVSTSVGTTQLKAEIFKKTCGGTETTLFSQYSQDINNTDYTYLEEITSIQPQYTLNTTDKLGVRIYAKTTHNAPVTVYYESGDNTATHINTPLAIRHNQLRDLNGDSNYLHVTSTEKSTWNGKQDALGYTPENVINKVTSISGSSTDTQYPSAKLLYDQLATKQPTGSYEVTTNKKTDLTDNSDTYYPSQKAVKTAVDGKISKATNVTSINDTGIADGEIAIFNLTNKDIRTSDKTITTTLGTDDTTLPTSKAVKNVTDSKQATLVSGTNIKTINSNSLLGSGDLTISEFTDEKAQDAVGTILADTSTIDFTYTDATPSITADVKDASISLAKMANLAQNTIIGRATASTGVPEALTAANVRTIINVADGATANTKATGAEIDTGTDDVKFATPKAIADSKLIFETDIIDNLTSTSTTDALSANQGKVLKDSLDSINGAWSTYTNTLGGITIGNGSVVARYKQNGKTVHFYGRITFGSTTSVTGSVSITLPVAIKSGTTLIPFNVSFQDSGTNNYIGLGIMISTTYAELYVINTSGSYSSKTNLSSTVPFTWTNTDEITFSGTYEAN